MKKTWIYAAFPLLLAVASCNGKQEQGGQESQRVSEEPQVQAMPKYHHADTVRMGGHVYTYDILRQSCDSLPRVKDDMGDDHYDNTIRLQLMRDGEPYFTHTFTKQMFRSTIEAEFYAHSILDGLRFMREEKGKGLVFTFSVSYPNSDMSIPFSLMVADNGTYSFERDDVMDVE